MYYEEMERPSSPLTYTPDEGFPPPPPSPPTAHSPSPPTAHSPSLSIQLPPPEGSVLYETLQRELDEVMADIRGIRLRVLRLEEEKKKEASRPYMSTFWTTTTVTFAFFVFLSYMSA